MPTTSHRSIIVVPALNEAGTIAHVVSGARVHADMVIVVDDGSSDDTGRLAEAAGAIVLRHEIGKGYEESIEDGFKEAVRQDADIIVTMDADGQHRTEDIERIITPIAHGEADLVVGERSAHIHIAERLFSFYTNARFGIRDPLCGFKAYARKVYASVGHFDTLRLVGTQLACEAVKRGFRLKNVPVIVEARTDTSRFYARRLHANIKIIKAIFRSVRSI